MKSCDVLVLPTLFEGQALVVLEGLAQGLPAITTENSGCGDLIKQHDSGWIVPLRSADAILNVLTSIYENPHELEQKSVAALEAASSWRWQDYRRGLRTILGFDANARETRPNHP
jgi:glycosyltransferase involved in cell wall biosynthesis